MKRRDFFKRSGLAVAASMAVPLLERAGLAETQPQVPAEKMKRIGCTAVCFRTRFPQARPKNYTPTEPDLTLLDVPDLFAEKMGVHNVEVWSKHFAERTPAYCAKARRAIEKAGSTLSNVQLDESGYNLSHPDKAERLKSVQFCKRWMDRSAACGATSMRANVGGSRKGSPFDLEVTYDIGRCVKLGESMGFKGIYSVEQWAPAYVPRDPFKAVRAIIADVAAAL